MLYTPALNVIEFYTKDNSELKLNESVNWMSSEVATLRVLMVHPPQEANGSKGARHSQLVQESQQLLVCCLCLFKFGLSSRLGVVTVPIWMPFLCTLQKSSLDQTSIKR